MPWEPPSYPPTVTPPEPEDAVLRARVVSMADVIAATDETIAENHGSPIWACLAIRAKLEQKAREP